MAAKTNTKAGERSPQLRLRPRSAAQRYEALKADIIRQGLSPADYAQACRRAARRAGL